jgi:hypothetical protein
VQTRGDNGGNDEFLELYNPTDHDVTLDATWELKARSGLGGLATCASNNLATRWTGAGQVIPSHGHILYANNTAPAYNGAVTADATYAAGFTDASSLVLLHGGTVVDAMCFSYDASSLAVLTGCSAPYTCMGTPVVNPHDGTAATNMDTSLERRPGGPLGNMTSTGDSAADFVTTQPASPRNLASDATP